MKLKKCLSTALAFTFALSFLSHSGFCGDPVDPDKDYDRLDGAGKSGKRVDVIEWEGNLELHIYPKGSTAGIGMKLDKKNTVMVLAYRFSDNPRQVYTRRNILGIKLSDAFKVYKDPSENEFDKFIVSDNGLSGQVVAFKLDPAPTNLYPEGTAVAGGATTPTNGSAGRAPASVPQQNYSQPTQDTQYAPSSRGVDDAGSLPAFYMNPRH